MNRSLTEIPKTEMQKSAEILKVKIPKTEIPNRTGPDLKAVDSL
jgi:hypothetical protein